MTPSNEQTVWNRGGRTFSHGRHLPRLPLGNVGIEGTSTIKHYTQHPKRRKPWASKKVEGKKGCKNNKQQGGVNEKEIKTTNQ